MRLLILLPITFIFFTLTVADESADFHKQQSEELKKFKQQQNRDIKKQKEEFKQYLVQNILKFDKWIVRQEKEFEDFKKSILKEWGGFEEPSNKKWVEYSGDRKSVTSVDFENGIVTVEALKSAGETDEDVKKRLRKAIERVITSKGSSKAAPVESKEPAMNVMTEPVLKEQVADEKGNTVDTDNVQIFSKETVKNAKEVLTPKKRGKIVVTFNLTPNHLKKRMKPYLPYVKKYSSKYSHDPAHVLATIHTESYFNPMARSHCNAIGLMQIVAKSGGRAAYKFVYGQDIIPKAEYLFNPEKNIELGCAYIFLLKNMHFGEVENNKSKLYCSIAGYNTGPGNVAYAFVGEKKVEQAVKRINSFNDSKKVYSVMIRNLPYNETKKYLPRVIEKMSLYQ